MTTDWYSFLPNDISKDQVGFTDSYVDATNLLDANHKQVVFMSIKNIPFERNKKYNISAVLPIQNRSFHLHSRAETLNLSLLGESQTIHYTIDAIPTYVRDFNEKVHLKKLSKSQENYDYLISLDPKEGSIPLNINEFIPPAGEGIYVAICLTENIDMRKKLTACHNEEAMTISNIQRSIMKETLHLDVIGIYVNYDANGIINGSMAYVDQDLQYISYSQSTSHQFAANFLNKCKISYTS